MSPRRPIYSDDSDSEDLRPQRPRKSRAEMPVARPRKSRVDINMTALADEISRAPRRSRVDMRVASDAPVKSSGPRKSRNEIPVFNDTRSRANANKYVPIASMDDDDDDGDEKTIVGLGSSAEDKTTTNLSKYSLKVIEGADTGRSIDVTEEGILVGRGDGCDLQLKDGSASRKHAKITLEGALLTIVDLGTSNGTKVNGQHIDSEQEEILHNGDRITIGLTVLKVEDCFANDGATFQLEPERETTLGNAPLPKRRNSRAALAVVPPPPMAGGLSQRSISQDFVDEKSVEEEVQERNRKRGKGGGQMAGTVLGDRIRKMSTGTRVVIVLVIFLLIGAGQAKTLISEHRAQKRAEEREMAIKAEAELQDNFERTLSEARNALRNRNPALAIQKIDEACAILPGRVRDTERLRSTAETDRTAEGVFKQAKTLHASGKFEEALLKLRDVDEKSSFADLVPELRKNIEKDALEALKKEIQNLMNDRQIDEARTKIASLPSVDQAIFLDLLDDASKQAKIEAREEAAQAAADAKNRARAAVNRRQNEINSAIAPFMEKIERADFNGAKKALDSINLRSAPSHVAQKVNLLKRELPKLKKDYTDGRRAFENKKYDQAADPLARALRSWRAMKIDNSSFGQKLTKHTVDCLEKKGTNALARNEYVTAGKAFKEALRFDSKSQVSQKGMNTILNKAKDISMQAYTERHGNPMRARQLYEQVVSMTPSDSEENKKAQKRLKELEKGY